MPQVYLQSLNSLKLCEFISKAGHYRSSMDKDITSQGENKVNLELFSSHAMKLLITGQNLETSHQITGPKCGIS